jgi:SAM-dependent methyltransferase/catechol 2,3-dioxygenase-like lactoylglutathione lyase family enzyme
MVQGFRHNLHSILYTDSGLMPNMPPRQWEICEEFPMATVQVRYIVDDVDASIAFYTQQLGFKLEMHPAPPFAMLSRGDLRLVLSAPNPAGGGGQPMPDGTGQQPGGWNRFAIEVSDLAATVTALRQAGTHFRNDVVTGVGGKQIIVDDPSSNPIELFEPTLPEARLNSNSWYLGWVQDQVGSMPQNIYDNPDFFAGYSQFRRSREGLAGAPEWPALRSMLPPLAGLRVLDLGCGFGAFCRWARQMGAESVLGVDLSQRMLDRARAQTPGAGVAYCLADIEHFALPDASFDLVYSSLALHYVENFGDVCAAIGRSLMPGGRLVFSVEHPIYTAPRNPGWQTDPTGARIWPVSHYLLEGARVTDWITPGVVKQHRTVASYVNNLLGQGFRLTRLEEWGPTQEQIAEQPDWADEVHRPIFLLIGARI